MEGEGGFERQLVWDWRVLVLVLGKEGRKDLSRLETGFGLADYDYIYMSICRIESLTSTQT